MNKEFIKALNQNINTLRALIPFLTKEGKEVAELQIESNLLDLELLTLKAK